MKYIKKDPYTCNVSKQTYKRAIKETNKRNLFYKVYQKGPVHTKTIERDLEKRPIYMQIAKRDHSKRPVNIKSIRRESTNIQNVKRGLYIQGQTYKKTRKRNPSSEYLCMRMRIKRVAIHMQDVKRGLCT